MNIAISLYNIDPTWYSFSHVVPSAPTFVQVDTVAGHPNQLLVMWQPPDIPNGLVTNYTAFCFVSSRDEPSTQTGSASGSDDIMTDPLFLQNSTSSTTVLGSEMSAVVSGFDPYTCYDCTVVAYTWVGEGSPSSFVSGKTDQSSKLISAITIYL